MLELKQTSEPGFEFGRCQNLINTTKVRKMMVAGRGGGSVGARGLKPPPYPRNSIGDKEEGGGERERRKNKREEEEEAL